MVTNSSDCNVGRGRLFQISLRSLIIIVVLITLAVALGPEMYYAYRLRYCFNQIRSRNMSNPHSQSNSENGLPVEHACYMEIFENRHRYFIAILEKAQDPSEDAYLRSKMLSILVSSGDLDFSKVVEVCLRLFLDDGQPLHIRESAKSVLIRDYPELLLELRRSLDPAQGSGASNRIKLQQIEKTEPGSQLSISARHLLEWADRGASTQ
jgi:hypothetical protein